MSATGRKEKVLIKGKKGNKKEEASSKIICLGSFGDLQRFDGKAASYYTLRLISQGGIREAEIFLNELQEQLTS